MGAAAVEMDASMRVGLLLPRYPLTALQCRIAHGQPQTISAHITIRGASEWSSKARLDGQAHVGVDHLLTRKPAFCTRPLELARAHLLARASNHFPIMLVKYELLLVVLVRSACPGLMCVTMTSTFGTTPNLSAEILPYVHQRALHGVPHLDRLEQAWNASRCLWFIPKHKREAQPGW